MQEMTTKVLVKEEMTATTLLTMSLVSMLCMCLTMPLYTPLYPLTIRDHVLGIYAVLVHRHAPLCCAVMDLAMCLNTVLGLFQDKRKLPWEQQRGRRT